MLFLPLLALLLQQIDAFCDQHQDTLGEQVSRYRAYRTLWESVAEELLLRSAKDTNEANAAAVDFLMLSGYVLQGYYLLRAAVTAKQKMADGDADGYLQAKLDNLEFYLGKILPRVHGLKAQIEAGTACYSELAGADFLLD